MDGQSDLLRRHIVQLASTLNCIGHALTSATLLFGCSQITLAQPYPPLEELPTPANLRDDPNNTGVSDFTLHEPNNVTTAGANAGVERSSVGIIDPRGAEHELQLTFTRVADDTWRLNVGMDASESVVVQDTIEPIEFYDDGTFRTTADPTIVLQIDGFDAPQAVRFAFSSDSTLQTLDNQGNEPTTLSVFLESSNVDIAFEFTRLIMAQRGFSANARTITVSDEVLEELTNIIR